MRNKWHHILLTVLVTLSLSSCCRSHCDMWEDCKTAGRYFSKGFGVMAGGDCCQSCEVCCKEDFCYIDDDWGDPCYDFEPLEEEDEDIAYQMALAAYNQPTELPGEPGGNVPGLEHFEDPSVDPVLAHVFQNVNFAYDSSLIKGTQNVERVRLVAEYMQKNPGLYLFVEGHCDLRGAEAYNLALGARRANTVRNMLIAEGVSKDRVFTISHGKEHPIVLESHDEAHGQNRRAEFKVYRP